MLQPGSVAGAPAVLARELGRDLDARAAHFVNGYLPATEVGGDFFQLLPGDDGSLLVLVGDVSGKGLKAAMTVSATVGALRNEKERQPSRSWAT